MRWSFLGVMGAVAAVLVGASGCSCGVSRDNFPERAAQTVCSKLYGCCTADEVKDNPTYGPDREACERNVRKSFDQTASIKESEQKKRLTFHEDRAEECLTQYEALSCEQLKSNATTVTPACDAYLEPMVKTGEACAFDSECIAGSCEGESEEGEGTCQPFIAENGSCSDGGVCGSGLVCGGGTCVRTKPDGEPCNTNRECATGGCNGRDPDAGVPGTCGPKGGEGTACYATTGCSSTSGGAAPLAFAVVLLGLGLRLVRSGLRREARPTTTAQ